MEYRAYLDLDHVELNDRSPWVYVTLYLEGEPPQGVPASYAVEIDIDLDGRGDWLIVAMLPPGSEWTTDGVRALQDSNNDVGGPNPLVSDNPNRGRDGYDLLIFDRGRGPDPDAAWIRRDPDEAARVQLAFKYSLIENTSAFLWGAMAFEGPKRPGWFDFNDHFTLEEAGSPTSDSDQYPVKELNLTDSTCRGYYGFEPTGGEPGMCGLPSPPTPEPNQPSTGWCVRALAYVGCANPCQSTCPRGSSCIPCRLVNISDHSLKCSFTEIDTRDVLERLAGLPITTWQYEDGEQAAWHMGPTAQDFYAAFGLGANDRSINSLDGDGVAFAAIQGLYQVLQEREAEIDTLEARIERLEDRPPPNGSERIGQVLLLGLSMLAGAIVGPRLAKNLTGRPGSWKGRESTGVG